MASGAHGVLLARFFTGAAVGSIVVDPLVLAAGSGEVGFSEAVESLVVRKTNIS